MIWVLKFFFWNGFCKLEQINTKLYEKDIFIGKFIFPVHF